VFNNIKKKSSLLLPLLVFIVLRIPSLFESYWYGDEGIYAALAKGLNDGKVLYLQVWDHKPPLLYFFYYLAGLTGWNTGFVLLRIASILFGIGTIVILYKLLKALDFKKNTITFSLLLCSILLGSTIFEGNVANAEVFFILFNVGILYLLYKDKNYALIGFLAALSFLIKTPSFIESAVLIFSGGLILLKDKNYKDFISKATKLTLGFVIPLAVVCLYFSTKGALESFIQGAFIQSFKYSGEMAQPFMIFGWDFSPSITKALLFLITYCLLILCFWKNQISKIYFLIFSLISVEIFAAFLSGRNYPHYMIQAIPGITLVLAIFLEKLKKNEFYSNLKYLATFAMFYQLVITSFTYGKPLNIYAQPKDYNLAFVNDVILKRNTGTFWYRDGDSVMRAKAFAKYFNENYNEYSNFYMYTQEPWTIALIDKSSTNKFVTWYHLGYSPEFMQESIEQRNKAELFIVDERPSKYEEFFKDLNNYQKVDENNDFSIYKKISL
jgi:hypothetical protein